MTLPSPLDMKFWEDAPAQKICEFTSTGELIANWAKLRECYDFMMVNRNNIFDACNRDETLVSRVLISAAIWKARNS